jgi:hypothetical protein
VADVDFFSFTANQGDHVFVSVDTAPSMTSWDSALRLFFGNRVIASDDDDGPNPQASGLAAVAITRAGTYHLEVRENRNDETISAYRLFLCVLPAPIRAESEPNDAPGMASVASNLNAGLIAAPADADVWQFPASALDTLSIGLDQTGEAVGFDAVLEVRDPAGTLLATQNNNGDNADDPEFFNLLSLPVTGVYTVRVVQAGMNQGSDRFDYLMGICLNGRPLRRHPLANAGPDQGVLETDTVTLDGSGSRSLDGEELSFEWTQVEGPDLPFAGGGVTATFIAPMIPIAEVETFVFELKVTTPFELSATDRVTVRVSDRFMLKDDSTDNRVLLNLAAPAFVWMTPTGGRFTAPMIILRMDERVIDLVGAEGISFAAGVDLETREGKAVLMVGPVTLQISDSNFADSQGPF